MSSNPILKPGSHVQEGYQMIVMGDHRRGLWMRTTPDTDSEEPIRLIEIRAGREGGDYQVTLGTTKPPTECVLHELAEALHAVRWAYLAPECMGEQEDLVDKLITASRLANEAPPETAESRRAQAAEIRRRLISRLAGLAAECDRLTKQERWRDG